MLSGSNATPLVSRYSCRSMLCRIFRLTFSECRTRIVLHPLRCLKKGPVAVIWGGGVSHFNFAMYRSKTVSWYRGHSLRIYPYPMVWPLPRPWSETMVSDLEIKGFLGLGRPFLDLVSQTPRPRGRGRPLFAYRGCRSYSVASRATLRH